MKTTREIQQEKIKEELELLQRIEKQEEERKNGIVRRDSFVWVPTLRTSSGVRFGYWQKARKRNDNCRIN